LVSSWFSLAVGASSFMPYRPKPKIKRPSWSLEADYYKREQSRLALVAAIKAKASRFTETDFICPGCDCRIWEAELSPEIVARGCHCITNLQTEQFSPAQWGKLLRVSDSIMALNQLRDCLRN
jgi:hypothetical protein